MVVQRRYRKCPDCHHRWYTLELPESSLDAFVPSDSEPFVRHHKVFREREKQSRQKSQGHSRKASKNYGGKGEPDPEYSDLAEVEIKNYWD